MAKASSIITPEEIRQKAERLYLQFVRDWLAGSVQFPLVVRASLPTTGSDVPAMIADRSRRTTTQRIEGAAGRRLHDSLADDPLAILWRESLS